VQKDALDAALELEDEVLEHRHCHCVHDIDVANAPNNQHMARVMLDALHPLRGRDQHVGTGDHYAAAVAGVPEAQPVVPAVERDEQVAAGALPY